MKNCIICNKKEFVKIKSFENGDIFECRTCRVAYTYSSEISNKQYLYDESELYKFNSYKNIYNQQLKKFTVIRQILNKYLKIGRILEIGAGFGLLSSIISKNKKYTVDALEPHLSLNYVKGNKNVNKLTTTYEQYLTKRNRSYDALLFIDVLEHFPLPDKILSESKKIMNDNCLLVIHLPNYKSLMAKIAKNWSWWMIEDHYVHFSKSSLEKLLTNQGFTVKYSKTYENFIDFKKNLDGNFSMISNSFIRKLCKGVYFAFFFPLYFLCRPFFWKLGYGGLLLVVAQYHSNE